VILKAENNANVTIRLTNSGTKPHDLVVQCLTANGCTTCFPSASKIAGVAPGASASVTFAVPPVEGIYGFASDLPGDGFSGQFIVQ
jgi:hypothetical protein